MTGPSSSSVETDLAHCVDLASLQLEAISLRLHGDGHGVDVLGAALGRHLQLRGLGGGEAGPGLRGRVSPVEAVLLAARRAQRSRDRAGPARPPRSQHRISIATACAVRRHVIAPCATPAPARSPPALHVHSVRQPAAGLRHAAAQQEEGQLQPHPRHQTEDLGEEIIFLYKISFQKLNLKKYIFLKK